jgi:mono/diheme cytochrome c family protein
MRFVDRVPKYLVLGVLAAGSAVLIARSIDSSKKGATVDVRVPELSDVALKGKEAFEANCVQCHGKNASGTDKGPPLVHDIYNPGHHADGAFLFAVRRGVRQHHWPYGNMPPQPQMSEDEIAAIVKYVRELQVANGITYRPHRM